MLKILGDMTLDELISYCDAHEHCWRCKLVRVCEESSVNISAFVAWTEIQVETK